MSTKIKFLTEVPTAYLDLLDPVIDGHFAIASECLKDPAYLAWYEAHPPAMLDNGMFEEGHPMSVESLMCVANLVKPKLVWAPDQVGDMASTLATSLEFLVASVEAGSPWQVGFIPQGKDPQEVAVCYFKMASLLSKLQPRPMLGISFLNDREAVLEEINSMGGLFSNVDLHFLGLYNLDEVAHWPREVVSMDTIKPFKSAYHGFNVEDCPRGLGKWNTQMTIKDNYLGQVYRNIAVTHKALRRPS